MTEHIRDDSNIVALFREWVIEFRRAVALPHHEEDKFAETVDRENAIRHKIADLPSTGPRDLAIKVFALMALMDGSDELERCSDADAERSPEAHVWNSVLEDIVSFEPELAPFVKGLPDQQPSADREAPRTLGDELGFGEYVPHSR